MSLHAFQATAAIGRPLRDTAERRRTGVRQIDSTSRRMAMDRWSRCSFCGQKRDSILALYFQCNRALTLCSSSTGVCSICYSDSSRCVLFESKPLHMYFAKTVSYSCSAPGFWRDPDGLSLSHRTPDTVQINSQVECTLPEMARVCMRRHTLRALVQRMHVPECADNTQTAHKAPHTARARPLRRPSASLHSGLVELHGGSRSATAYADVAVAPKPLTRRDCERAPRRRACFRCSQR